MSEGSNTNATVAVRHNGGMVEVEAESGGATVFEMALVPANARSLAASLLRHADSAEGADPFEGVRRVDA